MFVETCEIYTHPPLIVLFQNQNRVSQPLRVENLHDKADGRAISPPIAFLLSSFIFLKPCLTGLAFGSKCKLCSASLVGMTGMSLGFHANTSRFSWINSMSVLSYLSIKLDPMANCLEESPWTKSTIFLSWAALNFALSSSVLGLFKASDHWDQPWIYST